MSRICGI